MNETFLFYNIGGDFLSIAQRVKEEGSQVRFFVEEKLLKGSEDTGKGILDKDELVNDFWLEIKKHDKKNLVILMDDNGRGDMADYLRGDGYKVVGSSAFSDKIEHERSIGTKLMGEIGLKTPKTTSFNKVRDGISFVEQFKKKDPEKKFVFKPEGDEFAGGEKTYTAKNIEDLTEYMKWIESDCLEKHYEIAKFGLQEFVEGIEADFSAYFNGEQFMDGTFCLDVEEKKSGDGNKGQATGCMGNIVSFFPPTKYYFDYIKKLEPILRKFGYVGQIAINNIFEKESGEPYGLEFTPRFGWDAHLTEMAIIKEGGKKISDFYSALANKGNFKFPKNLVGCGVRVFCMTPGSKKEEVWGRRFSYDKSIEDKLWFYAASYKNDSYSVEGNALLVANTVAPTVKKAIDEVYTEVLPKLNISDIYYRMEIGKRAPEVLRFLASHYWLS